MPNGSSDDDCKIREIQTAATSFFIISLAAKWRKTADFSDSKTQNGALPYPFGGGKNGMTAVEKIFITEFYKRNLAVNYAEQRLPIVFLHSYLIFCRFYFFKDHRVSIFVGSQNNFGSSLTILYKHIKISI